MIPTQGINPAILTEQERNALAILVNLSPDDLARIKNFLHLGLPAVVGVTTLHDFIAACTRPLSTLGVSAFKDAHGLDDTGDNHGAIGHSTATAWIADMFASAAAPPRTGRQVTARGVHIVQNFEGKRLDAYQDQVGVWTIGYGHTPAHAGQVITDEQATALLLGDLAWAEKAVADNAGTLNDNQFDAFVSMCFNIGTAGFAGSTACREAKAGNYQASADAMLSWDKGTINGQLVVLPGLLARRTEERALFLQAPS